MSVQGDPAFDLQQSGVLACVGLLVVQCKGQSQPCWFKATQRSLCCLCRRAWFAMVIQSNSAVPVLEKKLCHPANERGRSRLGPNDSTEL